MIGRISRRVNKTIPDDCVAGRMNSYLVFDDAKTNKSSMVSFIMSFSKHSIEKTVYVELSDYVVEGRRFSLDIVHGIEIAPLATIYAFLQQGPTIPKKRPAFPESPDWVHTGRHSQLPHKERFCKYFAAYGLILDPEKISWPMAERLAKYIASKSEDSLPRAKTSPW